MKRAITLALFTLPFTLGFNGLCLAQDTKNVPAQVGVTTSFEAADAASKLKDYMTALSMYRSLAAQGDVRAQNRLGVMYSAGRGVTQDHQEAVRLYRTAAARGYAPAQRNLGFMYSLGRGVTQDHQEAVRLYRLAAAQGDATAQWRLGFMYFSGLGVNQDVQEAARLYRMAAAQSNAHAQYSLGFLYERGWGVAQNLKEALRWYELASAQGNEAGQGGVTRLAYVKQLPEVPSQAAPSSAALLESFKNRCSQYGYKKGSGALAKCVMELDVSFRRNLQEAAIAAELQREEIAQENINAALGAIEEQGREIEARHRKDELDLKMRKLEFDFQADLSRLERARASTNVITPPPPASGPGHMTCKPSAFGDRLDCRPGY